jgi:hypothetical protein
VDAFELRPKRRNEGMSCAYVGDGLKGSNAVRPTNVQIPRRSCTYIQEIANVIRCLM